MVDKVAFQVLLGTTFMDRIIISIHPAEKKIFLRLSPPVPVLMVQEAKSEAEEST